MEKKNKQFYCVHCGKKRIFTDIETSEVTDDAILAKCVTCGVLSKIILIDKKEKGTSHKT